MFPGIVTVTLVFNFKQNCLQVTFTFRDIKKKTTTYLQNMCSHPPRVTGLLAN